MAVQIAEKLELSGTLCVEMFATPDDIIINEIAPLPIIQDTIQLKPVIFHNLTHIFWEFSACHFQEFTSINQLLC